jgi:hypothetical protein
MVLQMKTKKFNQYLPPHLPLSWVRTDVSAPRLNVVRLPLSGLDWIPTAEIPCNCDFEQIYRRWLKPRDRGFVLQFCNPWLSNYLVQAGGQAIQVGLEAVLNLQTPVPFKASVNTSARRGQNWGHVIEAERNAGNYAKFKQLLAETTHHSRPQLALAFRTGFEANVRCFALVSPAGKWLGAVTLSILNPRYIHTELLLRQHNAPHGVMEALLTEIHRTLRAEQVQRWSLGAVPFARRTDLKGQVPLAGQVATHRAKTALLNTTGRNFNFAYNYKGLLYFKNKFSPEWRPLYLCGYPRLPWSALVDLALKMRYAQLVGYELADAVLPHTSP